MTEPKTKVLFRKFPEGDVIALMPQELGDSDPATCSSYQHIGQHGAADAGLCDSLPAATADEYAPLLAELVGLGYVPIVRHRQRTPVSDRYLRIAKLHAMNRS